MKESHSERLAIHTGLESCGVVRENNVEALTGEGERSLLRHDGEQSQGRFAITQSFVNTAYSFSMEGLASSRSDTALGVASRSPHLCGMNGSRSSRQRD